MARVALVTGGTRGIGASISKALKAAGYKVAASYAGNDAAAEKFKAETGIPVYKWDVSSFDACAAGVKKVEADLGPVDVLVNNAGITKDGAFHKMTLEQWNAVINTNLGSLFNMTRQVIEGMRARKFGRVINISSINGQKGQFGQVNYSAAKAGDIGFTKALALENAKGGITVNAICPGYINTEMVQAVPKEVLEKSILPLIPVDRLGEPEEIARAVVFLAADEAGAITGSTLTDQWRAISCLMSWMSLCGRRQLRGGVMPDEAIHLRAIWPGHPAYDVPAQDVMGGMLRRPASRLADDEDSHDPPAPRPDRTDRDPDVVAAGGADGGDRQDSGLSAGGDDVRDRRAGRDR